MLQNADNIAQQISRILYTFVLRTEICTNFEPKVVQISTHRIYSFERRPRMSAALE